MWITTAFVLLAVLLFFLIARKGRKLRTTHVLPPETEQGFLETGDGKKYLVKTDSQFYIGKKQDSDIVIANAERDYDVCIFYHRKRFAFQAISGREVMINGEEQIAGYLSDGDVLEVAGESFTFRVMSG